MMKNCAAKMNQLITVAILAFCCTPVLAQQVAEYQSISRQFFEQRDRLASKREMPRLTDVNSASVISALADKSRFLDTLGDKKESLTDLMGICAEAARITVAYSFFDLANQVDLSTASRDELKRKMHDVMLANTRRFQPELGLLQPFVIRCLAKQIAPTSELVNGFKPEELTAVRLDGLRKLRVGIANTYIRMLADASDDGLGDQYRSSIFDVLAETSETLQAVLQPKERQQVIQSLRSLPVGIQVSFESKLKAIEVAMSHNECADLCMIK